MNDEVYKAIGFMRLISGQAVDCRVCEERHSRDFMNDMQRLYQDIIQGDRGPVINWNELLRASKEELNMLGFMNWDNNTKFHLIPLWIFPFVPDDMVLTSFNGVCCKKSELKDLDTRFGCLAYGVMREVEDWGQLRNDWLNGLMEEVK